MPLGEAQGDDNYIVLLRSAQSVKQWKANKKTGPLLTICLRKLRSRSRFLFQMLYIEKRMQKGMVDGDEDFNTLSV